MCASFHQLGKVISTTEFKSRNEAVKLTCVDTWSTDAWCLLKVSGTINIHSVFANAENVASKSATFSRFLSCLLSSTRYLVQARN